LPGQNSLHWWKVRVLRAKNYGRAPAKLTGQSRA
jgi:hypothetical protein